MTVVSTGSSGRIVSIRIDDGRINVMTPHVVAELSEAVAASEGADAIVIHGRPGRFCAGFDLATLGGDPRSARALVHDGVETLVQLLRFPRPVVIACSGHAIGYGAFLLLAADVRVGSAGDYRIGLPELAGGIAIPPVPLALTRHRLTDAGLTAVLTASTLDPVAARDVGYLDIVAPSETDDIAMEQAARLAALPSDAFRRTKHALRAPIIDSMLATLDADLGALRPPG